MHTVTARTRCIAVAVLLGLSSVVAPATADEAGLSSGEVRRWMALRIELAEIQREMQRNAGAYDDLPRAYARRAASFLERRGYSRADFEAHESRIYAAADVLASRADVEAERARRAAEVQEACAPDAAAGIEDSLVGSAEQRAIIEQMRAAGVAEERIAAMREGFAQMPDAATIADDACRMARMGAQVEDEAERRREAMTRRDWPGVRPWLDALDQLTNWYAGNVEAPPALD